MFEFKVDHDKAEMEFESLSPGTYEMIIENAMEQVLDNGKEKISLRYAVRNDVDQPSQNVKQFDSIWMAKDGSGYVAWQLQRLAKASQIPNGKVFSSLEEFLDTLIGRPIKVTVGENEYNGKTYINVTDIQPTTLIEVRHQEQTAPTEQKQPTATPNDPFAAPTQAPTVGNDDLPF